MTAVRGAAVAFVVAMVLLFSGPNATATPRERPTGNVTAYDAHGHRLPANPVLGRGTTILVVVTGFAPHATVAVRLAGTSGTVRAAADASGTVRYAYTLAQGLPDGQYVLTFVGAPPSQATPSASALPGGSARVVVTVPTVGLFPFRDPDDHEPDGDDPDSDDPGSGVEGVSAATGNTRLSYTGADILGPLLIGGVAVVIGTAALALGRRRGLNRR